MNSTIAMITFRAMLGRRRAVLLFLLPGALLVLALLLRVTGTADLDISANVLQALGVATLLPLLALIAGTGVIGPEIDDGQIMYVLTTPVPRRTVIITKFVVALVLVVGFAVVPVTLAGLILTGTTAGVVPAYAVAMLAGAVAYTAVFTALAVASRNAVAIGLIYALVWEALLASFAPAAGTVSVQQWSLSIADALTGASQIDSSVSLPLSLTLLATVTVAGVLLAITRLRSLTVASAD
ncbi:ABC transporter permease [Actinomadura flavalba]|uniref:ABC transporter permease n=1 Tax=Actinomadura flavalba TaxID=1120938 RepID=UPI00036848EB|nr:ABC transporter permease [Actinomadura flavalba]